MLHETYQDISEPESSQMLVTSPSTNCRYNRFSLRKAQVPMVPDTFSHFTKDLTICTVVVISLECSVPAYKALRYVINLWEGREFIRELLSQRILKYCWIIGGLARDSVGKSYGVA
ncbi:hypothetical protein Tco_0930080 [Tanacetum coccineum]